MLLSFGSMGLCMLPKPNCNVSQSVIENTSLSVMLTSILLEEMRGQRSKLQSIGCSSRNREHFNLRLRSDRFAEWKKEGNDLRLWLCAFNVIKYVITSAAFACKHQLLAHYACDDQFVATVTKWATRMWVTMLGMWPPAVSKWWLWRNRETLHFQQKSNDLFSPRINCIVVRWHIMDTANSDECTAFGFSLFHAQKIENQNWMNEIGAFAIC